MSTIEKEVRRYLTNNPDFFKRHPDVLAQLALPCFDEEHVQSIYSHHLELLRKQNKNLQNKNNELNDLLEYNYNRLLSLRIFFDDLLFQKNEKKPLELLCKNAKKIDVDLFQFLVFDQSIFKKLEVLKDNMTFFDKKNKVYQILKEKEAWKKVLMGNLTEKGPLSEELAKSFGKSFNSYATIGVGGSRTDICLLLGHQDVGKFSPDMNDVLLKYIGIIISLMLRDYLGR